MAFGGELPRRQATAHLPKGVFMEISLDKGLMINGARQFIAIRAEKKGLPLLLYLHGGPGDAALPLVLKYNGELARHFTLVIWEQRGAGKSYYPFSQQAPPTIDTFLQDIHALVQWLLQEFGQEKVYLIGHSWGSVLGLRFCKQYPQLVQTYIGCGQVVHMKKSCAVAYNFAVTHAKGQLLQKLQGIDCTYTGTNWLKELLLVTKTVVKNKGSLYGATNYNSFVWQFLKSKDYTIKDLLNRQKGSLQSIQFLWQELMEVSFEDTTAFAVPIVLIEGRFDYHVSAALAKEYFDTITTPKTFHWMEQSCHFPQWSQAKQFNRCIIELLQETQHTG